MNNLQPVAAGLLASNAHSGLLFLGDNINDRLDSDYEIQARVISLLSSAGAEFLRGNHDSFDFETLGYNIATNQNDQRIVVQLRNFFPPALYVPDTNTLYTHNGVKLDATETKVLYAFPEQDGLVLNDEEPKGKQICDYITKNISFYNDYAKILQTDPDASNKSPTKFRPEMTELDSCAQRLGIKQVAGHHGYGVQTKGNATRINGAQLINKGEYMVPIAAITGV
ncbi:TPA: metallophosphoesterase [Escherichia coli]